MIVAKKLKELRTKLKKTQQQIAGELNVEQSTYSRYETGKTKLPLDIIQTMTEKFNIDPSEFFTPPNKSNQTNVLNSDKGGPSQKFYLLPKKQMDKLLVILETGFKSSSLNGPCCDECSGEKKGKQPVSRRLNR